MKILIADTFESSGVEALEGAGCQVVNAPGLSPAELGAALAEHQAEALIVRSTKVTAEALDAATALKLVVRAGAGTDTIDVSRASARGVFVANCPGKNAIAVAELTWGLILGIDRRIPEQVADLRARRWNKKEYSKAAGIAGKTVGLIGFGDIAREVAVRAQAFGCEVVAWSRSLSPERAAAFAVESCHGPLEVARRADIVSVHVASTPETRHLVDGAFVDAMKPGAILINTSRGAVVDEAALERGIAEKGLRAGLDVYEAEPDHKEGEWDKPLARLPAVVGTHHIGASTDQAQEAIAAETVRIVLTFRDSGRVLNCINKARETAATCLLTIRHRNEPGVLAKVFAVLASARINVEAMRNIIYAGGKAACARIPLGQRPSEAELEALRGCCEAIIGLDVKDLN